MKNILFFILAIGLAICIGPRNSVAQGTQDWHLWGLPEGVKARFGKGNITGGIASTSDGKRLAVGCSIGVWVYDTATDKPLNLIIGHTEAVMSVAFSPDGKMLASGSYSMIHLWEVQTGTYLRLLGDRLGSDSLVFSSDGKTLISENGNAVHLLDVETGIEHRMVRPWQVGRENLGEDAQHVAITSYHNIDVLLTWNLAHIANPNKLNFITRINQGLGLSTPELTTPLNYLGGTT